MMSVADIRRLPLPEKLQLMEALWEDLRSHIQDSPVPDWHKKLLDERRQAVEQGTEKILEWDDVKNTIGRRTR
jgi:putative addiction module component (TIGR02574 family)